MNKSEVTIVMPCYNSELTLSESIISVIKQTFANWILYIIDDNSTDSSFNIACKFATEDERIKVFVSPFHTKRGPYFPRNLGISKCKTRFLAFLDADDAWHKDKLFLQLNYHKKMNVTMTCTGYKKIHKNYSSQTILPPKIIHKDNLKIRNFIPLLTVILDINKIQSNDNLFFPCIPHEDYALWLRLFNENIIDKCLLLQQDLARYRVVEDSITSNKIASALWTYKCYRYAGERPLISLFYSIRCALVNLYLRILSIFKKDLA